MIKSLRSTKALNSMLKNLKDSIYYYYLYSNYNNLHEINVLVYFCIPNNIKLFLKICTYIYLKWYKIWNYFLYDLFLV